jgi:hypothetical protein
VDPKPGSALDRRRAGNIPRALRSLVYFVLVRLVGALTGQGKRVPAQLENVVLRHQVRVLRRSVRRPELKHGNRAFLAAASRALSRDAEHYG